MDTGVRAACNTATCCANDATIIYRLLLWSLVGSIISAHLSGSVKTNPKRPHSVRAGFFSLFYGFSVLCPFFRRLPYDWRAPVAYFITMNVVLMQLYIVYFLYLTNTLLYCGTCKFLIAFAKDLGQQVIALNGHISAMKMTGAIELRETRDTLTDTIREIVDFNCEIKELRANLYKSCM